MSADKPSPTPALLPGTVPLTERDHVDVDALAHFLAANGIPAQDVVVARYPGGHSNLTYAVVADGQSLVLRAPPPGAHTVSGHDVIREHDLLVALHPHYPRAPKVLAACRAAEGSPLGAPFYAMARCDGLILRARPPKDRPLTPTMMGAITTALADELAAIHAVDLSAAGLTTFGKPEGYVQRQVDGWCARYEKARTDEVSDIEALMVWLKANVPSTTSGPPTLVHNDFKLDNLVLDPLLSPDAPIEIRAVLDWELCTVGEPMTDLGTTLAYWVENDDGDDVKALPMGLTHLPGALRREEVVARWEAKSGRRAEHTLFYYLLASFKVATIAQQIYARFARGFTTDERFALLGLAVAIIGARAQRALEAGSIAAH